MPLSGPGVAPPAGTVFNEKAGTYAGMAAYDTTAIDIALAVPSRAIFVGSTTASVLSFLDLLGNSITIEFAAGNILLPIAVKNLQRATVPWTGLTGRVVVLW